MDTSKTQPDALGTLGTIIGEHERRDAIHLAVFPAVAAHTLRAGEHVGFFNGGLAGVSETPVGIVDPFLTTAVQVGQRFWLIVYPRQITSLRHVWTHPAFPEESGPTSAVNEAPTPQFGVSRAWLEGYGWGIGAGCEEILDLATRYLESDGYWDPDELARFPGMELPDEFWGHFEAATGRAVPEDRRGDFFKCRC